LCDAVHVDEAARTALLPAVQARNIGNGVAAFFTQFAVPPIASDSARSH
jgi:hypothetical protein